VCARVALSSEDTLLRRLAIMCWLLAATLPSVAAGQVVRDGSLGDPGAPLDVPPGTDANLQPATYLIEESYGETHGSNLFHSFSEFSVNAGETATFEGSGDVGNVFSRVTVIDEANVSNIFGTLRSTIPAANLFFLNPNGIVFGRDVSLDVQGSFHASTADSVRFVEDGGLFGIQPDGSPTDGSLLSASEPQAFGFTRGGAGSITVDGSLLTAPAAETISLVGGDVEVAGREGFNDRAVRIESGTVQIASVVGEGEVPIDLATFDVSQVAADDLGTVRLTAGAGIDVDGLFLPPTPGGRVVIRGGHLVVEGGSLITSANFSDGDAPVDALDVQVAGFVHIDDSEILSTSVLGNGDSGNLIFEAGDMTVRNGALINARTVSSGADGGDIVIDVAGTLRLETGGAVAASSGAPSPLPRNGGQGGQVRIHAASLEIVAAEGDAPTSLTASTFGRGDAGGMTIDAGVVHVSGSNAGVAARSDRRGSGDGGDISIVTDLLEVDGGAQLSVSATGSGDAGTLAVVADEVRLDGTSQNGTPSVLASQSIANASGDAGGVTLDVAGTLKITNGAQITASSQSTASGAAGSIDIRAQRLEMSGSPDGIRAQSLSLANDAGDISIRVSDEVKIQDSSISTESSFTSGGNIEISAGNLIRLRRRDGAAADPLVTAEVALDQATAGGSVTLDAKTVVVDTAGIRASSPGGTGGNIEIIADGFLVSGGDLVEQSPGFFSSGGDVFEVGVGAGSGSAATSLASTGSYFDVTGGLDTGTFLVRSPDAAVVSNLASLSQKFLDATKLQTNECAARRAPVGSLVVSGRDRVPAAPKDRVRDLYLVEM
jgi:filamentous hemagglutinin family protein